MTFFEAYILIGFGYGLFSMLTVALSSEESEPYKMFDKYPLSFSLTIVILSILAWPYFALKFIIALTVAAARKIWKWACHE